MVQYLVILLDDAGTSYCHYEGGKAKNLMPLDTLRQGILYAMRENLMIQFVYPDYELPQEYKDVIDSIDHSDIVSSLCEDKNLVDHADVIVMHEWTAVDFLQFKESATYVLRTSKDDLFDRYLSLKTIFGTAMRLNVVITDVETFTEEDFEKYKVVLSSLLDEIEKLYVAGKCPQMNILTDRMMLEKMNNCNAGWENITLAPDGRFYVCPAFYLAADDEDFGLGKAKYSVGDLENGLDIKNPQLYRLDHAPLCRKCDAYQCKRCVWLNRKMTYEVNTPGHEQCVIAHLERNASRELLNRIRKHGAFLPEKDEIKEIDYLDPFDVKEEW